jgi:hypothetical protein
MPVARPSIVDLDCRFWHALSAVLAVSRSPRRIAGNSP